MTHLIHWRPQIGALNSMQQHVQGRRIPSQHPMSCKATQTLEQNKELLTVLSNKKYQHMWGLEITQVSAHSACNAHVLEARAAVRV